MPEKDFTSYMTILGSCRTHNDIERAERIYKEMSLKYPMNCSTYVVMSNIYLKNGKMEEAERVRQKMNELGIKKIPGITKFELKGKLYEVYSNDGNILKDGLVKNKIEEWNQKMKEMGYLPDVSFVTKDLEEDDKPESLCKHSERIAMALGCVYLEEGKAIKLIKNLRVCGDCHNATKFITLIEKREVIVRDANRFHHFKNGKCSCNDFF